MVFNDPDIACADLLVAAQAASPKVISLVTRRPLALAFDAAQAVAGSDHATATKATKLRQVERSVAGCPGLKQITYSNGRKVWVYRYTDPITGKRDCVVLGDCIELDEIDARIKVRELQTKLKAGVSPRADRLTLAKFFDGHYARWARLNKKSWRDDISRFDAYVRGPMGSLALGDITTRQMARLVESLRTGKVATARRAKLSDATANAIIALFKAIFREARKADFVESSPAAGLQLFKLNNRRQVIYTDAELAKILPAFPADKPLLRLLFVLQLATAARVGELLMARHTDLDLSKRTLYIGKNKADRPIELPLSDQALDACYELKRRARPGNPYLFPSARTDGPISPPNKALRELLTSLGIENRNFHDARRTAITTAVQAPGVSLLAASKLANHSSVAVTEQRYVVFGQDHVRAAAQAIGRQLPLRLALRPRIQPTTRSVVMVSSITFLAA